MSNFLFTKLSEKYPFITIISYGSVEYVGIIQNQDPLVTNLYDFGSLFDPTLKRKFLELGEQWWWESNRKISIDLFLKDDWVQFESILKSFSTKEVIVIHGPVIRLSDLLINKSKRRNVTLVRRIHPG